MFQWKKEYCIDSDEVDQEHQHLFELANRVLAFENPTNQMEAVRKAIRDVYEYIRYHFDHEQELMLQVEFPGYEDHVKKHNDITRELNAIMEHSPDIKLFVIEFKQLMAKWVLTHIIEEDTKLSPYVKDRVLIGSCKMI